jgi:subtilisin family serine protease
MKTAIRGLLISIVILSIVTFAIPSRTWAEQAAEERVLVQFKAGCKRAVKQAAERDGGQIHYEFDELNTISVSLPVNAIERLRNNPNVLLIEKDEPRYLTDQVVPFGIDQVEARDVWDADHDGQIDAGTPTGAGRRICVIDSGVYAAHEDLASVNFAGGYPSDWNTDGCGHGTHVVGTIVAMDNTAGVVGVSPGTVSLYIVKVFGNTCSWTYSSTLIDAANRCRNAGANIINMSLAGSYYSSTEDNAFRSLYNSGILLVAAADNNGGTAYAYPASYDSVISVAAVDQNNVVASFSRQNDQVELAAPGVSVYSTLNNGGYGYKSGTSMAAPHVSAAAAVIWSSEPSKTNAEIRSAMQTTTLDLGTPGRDNAYGYGLVRTKHAYYSLSDAPTSVDLARFEAMPDGTSIRVEWETASELDNLGFHLYRAESPHGVHTRLNDSLIPSEASSNLLGVAYNFVDAGVNQGMTYYYWLEAVDLYGEATLYGPASMEVPAMHRLLPARHRLAPQPSLRNG